MEDHPGLRTFVVSIWKPEAFDYSGQERLLFRNRNIIVRNKGGHKHSNGSSIDLLYSLNRLYQRSATLVKESTALRPMLVTTNFQHTALLMSDHPDMLCEFIMGLNLDTTVAAASNGISLWSECFETQNED